MENEKTKRRKIETTNKILPYFIAISDDLMFFIAIQSLFFTVVKGLMPVQMTFLASVSGLSAIIFQPLILKLINKIGNIKSIRLGTIFLLASSIIITFAKNYYTIIFGYILYSCSFILKKMDRVVLKNNLTFLGRKDDYIKIANKSKIIYSVFITIIAFIAGIAFATNYYLPMYFCIAVCIINFLLTFCIFDAKEQQEEKEIEPKQKVKFGKIVWIIFISYGLLYSFTNRGQQSNILLIQNDLEGYFNIKITSEYLGFILLTARLARILGNLVFRKIYPKLKDKTNLILPVIVMIAFIFIAIGNAFNTELKFFIMAIGLDLIFAVRDWVEVYASDIILKTTEAKNHQKAISYLQLSRRIGQVIVSLFFVILSIETGSKYTIFCLMGFAIISFIINFKLYKMLKT